MNPSSEPRLTHRTPPSQHALRRDATDLCAPDLSVHEAACARWFHAVPRVPAPKSCATALAALPLRGAQPRGAAGLAWRPFAAAAAVLLALVLPAEVGTQGVPLEAPVLAAASSLAIIDDPSVTGLHGIDTFDQLAWMGPHGPGLHRK